MNQNKKFFVSDGVVRLTLFSKQQGDSNTVDQPSAGRCLTRYKRKKDKHESFDSYLRITACQQAKDVRNEKKSKNQSRLMEPPIRFLCFI